MFQDKRTGVWQTKIKGRQVSLKTKDKKFAKMIEQKLKLESLKDSFGVDRDFKLTVAEGYELFINSLRDERGDNVRFKRKLSNLGYMYGKHIQPRFGRMGMMQVKCDDVHGWANELAESSHALANRVTTLLRSVYKHCLSPKNLRFPMPFDPVRVWPRFEEKPVGVCLTSQEIEVLMTSENPDYKKIKPMVIFALFTGLRRENLQKLKWSWIDFDKKLLTIPASEMKSGKEHRIPILPQVEEILFSLIDDSREYVFVKPDGNPWEYGTSISRAFRESLKVLGFKRQVRFHDLRHTCGTLLIEGGITVEQVQNYLAHSDTKTTQRYVHMSQEHLREALTGWGISCQPNVNRIERKWEETAVVN